MFRNEIKPGEDASHGILISQQDPYVHLGVMKKNYRFFATNVLKREHFKILYGVQKTKHVKGKHNAT